MTACPKCSHDPDAIISASWSFHVPRRVTSGNRHVHNVGGSRHAYRAERDGWSADMNVLRLIHSIPAAKGKRRVTLTRIIGHRERAFDRDNLATGLKPCVDAMVRAGLLVNDDPAHAEIHYAQRKGDGTTIDDRMGLDVLIEELAS